MISMAYFTARGFYNIIRELPTGKGFADFVFLPMVTAGSRPPMILELKYNQSAEKAIEQIKTKNYFEKVSKYNKTVLLVGINYDQDKNYTAAFEEYQIE